MGERTNISFAHHTGSPWIGCAKVNDDCANCYADALDIKRFSKTLGGATKENPIRHWGKGKPRVRTIGFWNEARRFNEHPWICECGYSQAQNIMCAKCGSNKEKTRARMFPSLCDWLDDEVPIEWLADFLKLVYECQNLTWMLFTKRPELFEKRLREASTIAYNRDNAANIFVGDWLDGRPPKHVWVFASAGNQKNYNTMIEHIHLIPATVLGLSCEPMTGPIDFRLTECNCPQDHYTTNERLDVIIFGGESDQERPARPCDVHWIQSGVKQCRAAGVMPYVKQLGSNVVLANGPADTIDKWNPQVSACHDISGSYFRVNLKHRAGADINEWPEDLRVRELPEGHR